MRQRVGACDIKSLKVVVYSDRRMCVVMGARMHVYEGVRVYVHILTNTLYFSRAEE